MRANNNNTYICTSRNISLAAIEALGEYTPDANQVLLSGSWTTAPHLTSLTQSPIYKMGVVSKARWDNIEDTESTASAQCLLVSPFNFWQGTGYVFSWRGGYLIII